MVYFFTFVKANFGSRCTEFVLLWRALEASVASIGSIRTEARGIGDPSGLD